MVYFCQRKLALFFVIFALEIINSQGLNSQFVFDPGDEHDTTINWPDSLQHLTTSSQPKNFDEHLHGDGGLNHPMVFSDSSEESAEERLRMGGDGFWSNEDSLEDDQAYSLSHPLSSLGKSLEDSQELSWFEVPHVAVMGRQNPVKRRVKRRIIPVSKTIERARSGRRRNPFETSRNTGSSQGNYYQESVVRRRGPTGTAALFELYPELAPPGWNTKSTSRGRPNKDITMRRTTESHVSRTTSPSSMDDEQKDDQNASPINPVTNVPEPQQVNPEVHQVENPKWTRKSKIQPKKRLPKDLKEEIAIYAQKHGIRQAIDHFQFQQNIRLKEKTIIKYMRRYQKRMMRRLRRN